MTIEQPSADKAMLRSMVRGAYDLQKLRIQLGLRVVANFKVKLGQDPGSREDDLNDDAKDMLKELRLSHRLITDAIVEGKSRSKRIDVDRDKDRIAAALESHPGIISSYTELVMVGQYLDIESAEKKHFREMETVLGLFPIYTSFLRDIRGIGPAMAGVLVSEIDIHKARHPSSLWKYAGLDVVGCWRLAEIEPISGTIDRAVMEQIPHECPLHHQVEPAHVDGVNVILSPDGQRLSVAHVQENSANSCWAHYAWVCSGGRSRRGEHLVDRDYIDKDGEPATRKSITFNPWLKTKLVGVMADVFLKLGSPYREHYDNYKLRMESHAVYGVHNDGEKDADGKIITRKARRNNMAKRYMMKMFLIDLYTHWRALEGLPVSRPYHEAKLGHKHHDDAA